MNEEAKDKGLKKAMQEQSTFRLSPNFAYRTMQKVEESVRLREKRTERRTLLATIIAAVFLIGSSIVGLIVYFGDTIREAFTPTAIAEVEKVQIPSFYLLILIAIPLFMLFDRWMRRQYFKRHS